MEFLYRAKQFARRSRYKIFGNENRYKGMSNSEIFDSIYRDGAWGTASDGLPSSGSGSHDQDVIAPYIQKVAELLSDLGPDTIVDLGCGDFNVGRYFVPYAQKYVACDISSVILERNRSRYSTSTGLEFRHLDLTCDALPVGDVCFVRQVLQHLSNDNIEGFVRRLNDHRPYKYLILTEHLPRPKNFKRNLNKPSGPNIRLYFGSGIVLHEPPFNLRYRRRSVLLEVPESGGIIQTLVYEL